MNNWFYFLALTISAIFAIAFFVIFLCSVKIYFNVSSIVEKDKEDKDE